MNKGKYVMEFYYTSCKAPLKSAVSVRNKFTKVKGLYVLIFPDMYTNVLVFTYAPQPNLFR